MIILLLFSLHTSAQSPSEIAELAISRSPQRVMNQEDLSSLSLEVKQSHLWKNPELSMQTGKARTGRDSAMAYDLTLMQPIPWPGSRDVLKKEAQLVKDLALLDNDQALLHLYHVSYLLSLELGYFERMNESNKSRSKRLSEIKNYLNAKTAISENDKIERDMIHNQMLLVDNFIFEVQSKINNIRSKLKRLTNTEIGKVKLKLMPLKLISKDEMLLSLKDSPAFKRKNKQIELAKNKIKKTELETKPEFSVGLNYRVEHLNPANEFVHANVAVTLPIWDRGQYREESARASLRQEEARGELSNQELLNTFDELYHQLELSFYQSKNFDVKNLSSIERRVKDAEKAFRKGRITAASLLQVDTLAQESIDVTFKSRYQFFKSLADLHDLLGQKMEL